MIFARIRRSRQQQRNHLIKSNRYYLYIRELEDIDFDLSQQTCIFKINYPIVRDHFLVISMYIRPLIGLYQEIEFRPQMYINLFDNFASPRILNDRKIYHPNIDFISGEIYVPFILNWDPTISISKHLATLKYTLIQPNPQTVPNNKWNIDAASIFILSRDKNYRQKIIQNSPYVLQEKMAYILENNIQMDQMVDEKLENKKFLSFGQILPLDRSKEIEIDDDDDQSTQFQQITKKIKSIKLQNGLTKKYSIKW